MIIKLFNEVALLADAIVSISVGFDNTWPNRKKGAYQVVITMTSRYENGENQYFSTSFATRPEADEWYNTVVSQWVSALAKQEQSA